MCVKLTELATTKFSLLKLHFYIIYFSADDYQILQTLRDTGLMTLYERTGGLDVPVEWNW